MFHKAPVGKYVIHVCGTLSCALCGAGEITKYLKEKLKIDVGETTEDGRFHTGQGGVHRSVRRRACDSD